MNRFIRGLDDRKKLDRVLETIGYRRVESNLYTLPKLDNKYYLFIQDDTNLVIRFYNRSTTLYVPLNKLEIRLLTDQVFLAIELLYADGKIYYLHQLFVSNDKDVSTDMLNKLQEYMEGEE